MLTKPLERVVSSSNDSPNNTVKLVPQSCCLCCSQRSCWLKTHYCGSHHTYNTGALCPAWTECNPGPVPLPLQIQQLCCHGEKLWMHQKLQLDLISTFQTSHSALAWWQVDRMGNLRFKGVCEICDLHFHLLKWSEATSRNLNRAQGAICSTHHRHILKFLVQLYVRWYHVSVFFFNSFLYACFFFSQENIRNY